jgi:hypothetical protein
MAPSEQEGEQNDHHNRADHYDNERIHERKSEKGLEPIRGSGAG